MKSLAEHLRIRGALRLADWNPRATPTCDGKDQASPRLEKHLERIDGLQYRLHAEARQSLLIVLQGMDTSGKDGVIRRVMTVFNPQGCKVWPFKVPTSEEAAHDFLWRIHNAAPPVGEVAIFNRSHYEDVLVPRVHRLLSPHALGDRYRVINEFERHLREHGTHVLKFFLHISREEQRERLLARLDQPLKRWKFNAGDLLERSRWQSYQRAYEIALSRCNTRHSPWYVIPADRKWYRDLAVSEIVAGELEAMKPRVPSARLPLRKLRAD